MIKITLFALLLALSTISAQSPSPSPSPVTPPPPFEGECVPVTDGTLYFCTTITYDVFLAPNLTLWEVEQQAQTAYLTASLSIGDSCCLLPYRDFVCASLLPRCLPSPIPGTAIPLKPCSNWLCTAQVLDEISSLVPCFSCDSYELEDGELCSCPNENATGNSECLPYEVYDCLDSSSSVLQPIFAVLALLLIKAFI